MFLLLRVAQRMQMTYESKFKLILARKRLERGKRAKKSSENQSE
jgi:hypothetical protein